MRDLFFFPLAALFVAGIIYVAVNAGGEVKTVSDAEILKNGYEMSGADFAALTASPGTNFVAPDGEPGGVDYAVLSAQVSKASEQASIGIFATLGPEYEKAFAEREIKVGVRARRGTPRGSKTFKMGYYTLDAGASGWKTFTLTDDFQNYSFKFKPGLPQGEAEIDYLGIWPAPEGENQSIDVERITVKVVTP